MRADLRLLVALAALAAAVLTLFRDSVVGPAMLPLEEMTARAAAALIRLIGIEASRQANLIYQLDGFGYQISRGCVGLIPVAFLVVAICASDGDYRHKLVGVAIGIPLLIALNMARLVHLFYLGVYRPRAFHMAHKVVWQAVVIAAVFAAWLWWSMWADRRSRSATHDGHSVYS
jgi:exosortase/archaeosortase family protein